MIDVTADTVVVPLASVDDAHETSTALRELLDAPARVVLVHVVEKAGGAPDKASVEQREERAEKLFAIARQYLDDYEVDSRIHYGTDVAETVFEAADHVEADLIAFSARDSSRLVRLLTGDVALDLITDSARPVLALPTHDDSE